MHEADKTALRRKLRRARRTIDSSTREAAHVALGRHLETLVARREPGVVAVYAAGSSEASPQGFADRARASGWIVVYPRVERETLVFCETSAERLQPGHRGILEPDADAPEVQLADIDLLLVPGLGFDARGNRLGQGGGFYDRVLAAAGPETEIVGVAYAVQCVPELPVEPHDQPVHRVVTEEGVAMMDAAQDA